MKPKNDKGFTLIELLVVILIIAILAAVGIVALLGAIRSGQDSAAKTTLANATKEIRVLEINDETIDYDDQVDPPEQYIIAIVEKMNEISPDFTWQTTAITGDPTQHVTFGIGDAGFSMGTRSKSGNCFYMNATGGFNDLTPIRLYKSKESSDSCALAPSASDYGNNTLFQLYK
jgi:prepilin-type N-terminal cleavage/methylation domain-containing protein